MRDIAMVMVTVDRSPGKNYLRQTLENLLRGAAFRSPRLHSFHVADSGADGTWLWGELQAVAEQLYLDTYTHVPDEPRCANVNVAAALRAGADTGAAWVLFVEDDIDVCADFVCGVGQWLDDHARQDRHVYAFGSPYPQVQAAMKAGKHSWDCPVRRFYGTQAFVVSRADAKSLAQWLERDPYAVHPDGVCYDIVMHKWSQATWPDVPAFVATAPSFVQHLGMASVIAPRNGVHTCPSWQGRDWRYEVAAC